MTQEDKELLLKDICVRLPYGVKIQVKEWATVDTELKIGHISRLQYDEIEVKPYLRPMYSMTEEEKNDYLNTFKKSIIGADEEDGRVWTVDSIDYLNANHFDYRGLIEKGLAIEAPEGMYDIKEK